MLDKIFDNKLVLIDREGNELEIPTSKIKCIQNRKELGVENDGHMAVANGNIYLLLDITTENGIISIPRSPENDTEILDFILKIPGYSRMHKIGDLA